MYDIFSQSLENNQSVPPHAPVSSHEGYPHAGKGPVSPATMPVHSQQTSPPPCLSHPPHGDHGAMGYPSRGSVGMALESMGGRLMEGESGHGASEYTGEIQHGGGDIEPEFRQGQTPKSLQRWFFNPHDPESNDIERKFRRLHDDLMTQRRKAAGAKVTTYGWGPNQIVEISGGKLQDHDLIAIDKALVVAMRNDLIGHVRAGRQVEADHLRWKLFCRPHVQPDFAAQRERLAFVAEKWRIGSEKLQAGAFPGVLERQNAEEWLAKYKDEGQRITNELGLVRPWLLEDLAIPWL